MFPEKLIERITMGLFLDNGFGLRLYMRVFLGNRSDNVRNGMFMFYVFGAPLKKAYP